MPAKGNMHQHPLDGDKRGAQMQDFIWMPYFSGKEQLKKHRNNMKEFCYFKQTLKQRDYMNI